MCAKPKSLRARLATSAAVDGCYYCGLPFGFNPVGYNQPAHKRFARHAKMTLEHLTAIKNDGVTDEENCVLAHAWCNSLVDTLPLEEKLLMRDKLREYVARTNTVPWPYRNNFRPKERKPLVKKPRIKGKKLIREAIACEILTCHYCGLAFGLNPVAEGKPFYKKLKSRAKMVLQILIPLQDGQLPDKSNSTLVHHWCHQKTNNRSPDDRQQFKAEVIAYVQATERLPWIEKKMIAAVYG